MENMIGPKVAPQRIGQEYVFIFPKQSNILQKT